MRRRSKEKQGNTEIDPREAPIDRVGNSFFVFRNHIGKNDVRRQVEELSARIENGNSVLYDKTGEAIAKSNWLAGESDQQAFELAWHNSAYRLAGELLIDAAYDLPPSFQEFRDMAARGDEHRFERLHTFLMRYPAAKNDTELAPVVSDGTTATTFDGNMRVHVFEDGFQIPFRPVGKFDLRPGDVAFVRPGLNGLDSYRPFLSFESLELDRPLYGYSFDVQRHDSHRQRESSVLALGDSDPRTLVGRLAIQE